MRQGAASTRQARDTVERAVHSWNDDRADAEGYLLRPRRWESGSIPIYGRGDAQSVINSQLVDTSDIVVAIFFHRLGSPTERATSGTAEEINRSVANGKPVHIYFAEMPLPHNVDTQELEALRVFRAEIQKQGLVGTFNSEHELRQKVLQAIEFDLRQMKEEQAARKERAQAETEGGAIPSESLAFDVRTDGLFMLGEWSPNRLLKRNRLVTSSVPEAERPVQTWLDPDALRAQVATDAQRSSGDLQYFVDFRLDHRESDETQYCRIRQADSWYPEVLAIEHLRIRTPELFERCDRAIEEDVRVYLKNPVPSSIAVNLVLLSERDELLCVQRSAAVDSAVGWWTAGVFETMKRSDPNRPGAPEDLFGLAWRGLTEELGLDMNDYGRIHISWVGIYRPILRGHVVALARLQISAAELLDRARTAHSGYEHAAVDWLPLRRSLVSEFTRAERQTYLTGLARQ